MKKIALGCLVCCLFVSSAKAQKFVHTQGKFLVDARGQKFMMRGTNLGNWLVAEGYMFHFDGGPQSAREIEALTTQLIGPSQSAEFWQQWREHYLTKADIDFLKSLGKK